MDNTIVIATGNKGKVKEMLAVLDDLPFNFVPQSDYKVTSAPENGVTFVENALIKARFACRETGLPAISDDSGLMVDALGGRPGIYSSRYGGTNLSAQDKMQCLLQEWRDGADPSPQAQFYCAVVFLRHAADPTPIIAHGIWQGELTENLSGAAGFGYDPLFYLPDLGCTAADLSIEQKNKISHRAQALQSLKRDLSLLS